ncbi:MAG: hypothetical protein UR61_C0024G0002 [candidate division WS6 bacterium GW2011_GWE1_34_7]|uniref:Uncharacterized protein n=1 Tax=candidate division WS6 bacterium GW2011_GWE1_34_7 TaxID=1619093 RepID=A0A0G0EDI0_9BACT|nr:MAG: hypothetical protein UR61_C0024G0002 [candidate division WS6 bacterium GW2011_GWE1_34_7]
MWVCTQCDRIFKKVNQPHSCKSIPLEQHFKNKDLAKSLFEYLLQKINTQIGTCKIISIPCCIHLFGNYDFLAILPHKDRLEIRFAAQEDITCSRITQTVKLSNKLTKICIDIKNRKEIDDELLKWLKTSYHLKTI